MTFYFLLCASSAHSVSLRYPFSFSGLSLIYTLP